MVDVKKVTASITKPYLYLSQSSDPLYINFNPANNPPVVPGAENINTVYTIDPFALFIQESSELGILLKAKIPFTRFYKVKYVIYPRGGSIAGGATTNSWKLNKSHTVFSESVKLKRFTSGVQSDIYSGIYRSDGSAIFNYEFDGGTGYLIREVYTAAIFEGIVELYAGDELRFEHTLSVYKTSYPNNVLYTSGVDLTLDNYPGGMSTPLINNATSGFYFEIAEITDL